MHPKHFFKKAAYQYWKPWFSNCSEKNTNLCISVCGYKYLFTCSSTHQVCTDLIKEKIELKPIQLVGLLGIRYDNRDYSFYSNVVSSCCIDLLVCRGADKRIWASVDTAGQFFEEIPLAHSYPTTPYGGFWVQSLLYYDVFLITNQRAISIMLTAFFLFTRSLCLY